MPISGVEGVQAVVAKLQLAQGRLGAGLLACGACGKCEMVTIERSLLLCCRAPACAAAGVTAAVQQLHHQQAGVHHTCRLLAGPQVHVLVVRLVGLRVVAGVPAGRRHGLSGG